MTATAKVWMARMISNDFDIEDLIRSIQKDAKEDYSTDLCEFAEWCSKNFWHYVEQKTAWVNTILMETKTSSDLKTQWELETGRRKHNG